MLRGVALGLTLATGFSGLVYEVTWQRLLAVLLGSHAEATSAVLAIFLGGLAAGYTLFGRITRRRVARCTAAGEPPRLLRLYAAVEAGVGAAALALPSAFDVARSASALLPRGGIAGFACDVVLCALLVGPPAVLMGATIPVLTQALARSVADATRLHALVYATNTAGACLGALAAGFWLIPELGLAGVLRATAVVNLAAAGAFLWLDRRAPAAPAAAPEPAGGARPPRALAVVALLLGFAMMTLQTVLIRMGALSFGSSQLTFATVVAVFVLCIALGSAAVALLPRVPTWLLPGCVWALAGLLLLLHWQLPDAPYWAHLLRLRFPLDAAAFRAYPPLPRSASCSRSDPPCCCPVRSCRWSSTSCAAAAASSARAPAICTAGTRSARSSALCSAATPCSSGSTSTASRAARSAP